MILMITVEILRSKIEEFSQKHNVTISSGFLYALKPKKGEYGWPQAWPYPNFPGVYAFLDKDRNVVYIGTSCTLGARLNHYFKYGENQECTLQDNRVKDIYYVIVYACPQELFYMASSLEGYLISALNPKYNSYGRTC